MKNFILSTHDSLSADSLRRTLKHANLKGIFQVKRYDLVIGDKTVTIYSTSENLDSLGVEIKKIEKNQPQILTEENENNCPE